MATTSSVICLISILYTFCAQSISILAQQHNISIGSTLDTSVASKWTSPNGEFAFGFFSVAPSVYLVGVWFNNISTKTLVWTSNRDHPVEEGYTLNLTSSGLQLSKSQTMAKQIPESPLLSVHAAQMRDDGNFVLLNIYYQPIWQSFDTPTDTLLPGQTLQSQSSLRSNAASNNYSTGRFLLTLQDNGNLILLPADLVFDLTTYWSQPLALVNSTSNTSVWNQTTGMLPRRMTVDADGILRLYVWNADGANSWTVAWQAMDDPCQVTSQCGPNSICKTDQNLAVCSCLPGFNYINNGDHSRGCSLNISRQKCGGVSFMKEIGAIRFSSSNYFAVNDVNQSECLQACIEDCNCIIAVTGIFSGRDYCSKKTMPTRDGRQYPGKVTFVKIFEVEPPTKSFLSPVSEKTTNEGKGRVFLIVGVSLLGCSSLAVLSLIVWVCGSRRKLRVVGYQKIPTEGLQSFSYQELEFATGGFKQELGRGAFGKVYKGKLSDGRDIAVKKLMKKSDGESSGEKEFRTEMSVIGASHHKNLVQLYGFCDEGCHRLLVYEFMSNGSLDKALFESNDYLDWKLRVKIALGTARGILYLHQDCRTQILHCDIKPQNILLDEDYNAKISDFGMAKLMGADQTATFTAARGTIGYIAREWQRNMPVTAKVDVYSFGVVLLEISCLRKMVDLNVPENEIVLSDWVYDCLKVGRLAKLVEQQRAIGDEIESIQLERMVLVGLWCIQEDPSLRPSIKTVLQMLEGTVEIPVPPCPSNNP